MFLINKQVQEDTTTFKPIQAGTKCALNILGKNLRRITIHTTLLSASGDRLVFIDDTDNTYVYRGVKNTVKYDDKERELTQEYNIQLNNSSFSSRVVFKDCKWGYNVTSPKMVRKEVPLAVDDVLEYTTSDHCSGFLTVKYVHENYFLCDRDDDIGLLFHWDEPMVSADNSECMQYDIEEDIKWVKNVQDS